MGHTSASDCSSDNSDASTTVRTASNYSPVVQTAGNFHMITFTTNFTWNGTSNLVVDICTGSNPYTSPYGGLRVSTLTDGSRHIRTDGSSNCASATSTALATRPNTRFTGTSPPSTPNLYNKGGTSQLCFNNSYVNDNTPHQQQSFDSHSIY